MVVSSRNFCLYFLFYAAGASAPSSDASLHSERMLSKADCLRFTLLDWMSQLFPGCKLCAAYTGHCWRCIKRPKRATGYPLHLGEGVPSVSLVALRSIVIL